MTTTVVTALRAGTGFAANRLYRLMSMSLAITAFVELAAVSASVIGQSAVLGLGYSVLAVLLIAAPSVLGICLFTTAKLRTLRWVWRCQTISMLLVYVAIPVALAGSRLPVLVGLTWTSELEVVAGCAAVLAWRTRGAIIYFVVWQLLMFGIAILSGGESWHGMALADAVRQLFFVAMFMSLAAALLRAGRILDDTVDSAVAEALASGAAERHRTARRRVGMLVHDSIIVALLAYASGADRTSAATEARAALNAIAVASTDTPAETPVTPRQLAWNLQAVTTRLDPDIRFDYVTHGTEPLPHTVVTAVEEAFAEAVRNSIRHASSGRPASRQVHADVSPDHIEVLIMDDGDGFNPATIGPARLGIRQGIIGRLEAVPGGSAQVHSTAGYGTIVALRWIRP